MTIEEIKNKLNSNEYDFLREDNHLGENIILLTLCGSHAYGMDNENSDLDIRGIALNCKEEILLGKDFDQVVNTDTDTIVYSFNKILQLLTSNNPNTIEALGCKKEHYLHLSDIGKELLENRKMFLSQICIHSFGGYAGSQLRRMENKAARLVGQEQNEEYILKSINNAKYDFKNRYYPMCDGELNLYTDKAVQEGYESEIFMDINLKHYPLRDWAGMWNEMKAIVSSYNKIGKRNEKAMAKDKLGKHMAHLIRLYMMCIDILEKEEIITYRENEHDLLMSIRNGEYLDSNRQPTAEFYDLLNEYEKRFDYAKKNTSLSLENYKCEQDYFEEYNRVKDSAISDIKESFGYKQFIEDDMNKYAVTHTDLPTKDIFKPSNDGKLFISIDMRKANFSALKNYDSGIFDSVDTWEEFISRYTDNKHIINSKYIRQVILGNCNPKRQVTYEKYLMDGILDYTQKFFIPISNCVFFSNDEIVFDITDIYDKGTIEFLKLCLQKNRAVPVKIEVFTLHKIYGIQGYYKELEDGTIELKCLDSYTLPFVLRKFQDQEITESDKVFYHEGLLSKFIEVPNINVN